MDTDSRVEQWRNAKRDRDFTTADQIRKELRAEGIDPDQPQSLRKSYRSDLKGGAADKLEKWRAAKAERDYATADKIRAELRAEGIEPDASPRRAISIEEKV